MEKTNTSSTGPNTLSFYGNGATYFGIVALNLVLTILTLGLYYPWAKATYRKYLWNESEFKESPFVFNGTGKEMFKGFLIAYVIFAGFYIAIALSSSFGITYIFVILFYLLLMLLIPFAIYGAWRYRVTRTSWRGISFGFDGNLKTFLILFIKHLFFTIITLGIYSPWMKVKLQKYLFSHTYIGDLRFDFHGKGDTLFGINLLGIILIYPTLFIYGAIWMKNRFNFTINHTTISDGSKRRTLKSSLANGEALKVMIVNGILLIFTLGLAFPWVIMRSMRMFFWNTIIPDDFDYDVLTQTDQNLESAVGDGLTDIFDIDLDF